MEKFFDSWWSVGLDFEVNIKISQETNEFEFWHTAQFSQDYKNQFGELPSETLKSRKQVIYIYCADLLTLPQPIPFYKQLVLVSYTILSLHYWVKALRTYYQSIILLIWYRINKLCT